MHAEIRLCEVEHVCAFDPQSFYRVKQLLSVRSGHRNSTAEAAKRAPHAGALLRLRPRPAYIPELKVQVVIEHLIETESTCFPARLEKRQHEARTKSNWNNSAVGTANHNATIREMFLAALPVAAADSVVKLRLLQLPPALDYNAQELVRRELGSAADRACCYDTPLCIGVAKISLCELMSVRRTVCIAMQAKRTIVSAVEAHNLDTVITNAMFGRGESTGSAMLFLQVNGYTFGHIPREKMLPFREGTSLQSGQPIAEPETRSSPQASLRSSTTGNPAIEFEAESLNTAAIQFVLLPYMAFIDVLLRVVDIASWRVGRKSGMTLAMILIALFADLFDVLFVVMTALAILLVLRSISVLYNVTPVHSAAGDAASSVTAGGANDFHPFLFSRDNTLLNCLLRSRMFFSRGLMGDAYFELALAAHVLRHRRRQAVELGLVVCGGFVLLSMGTVVIILTVGLFASYPLYLNMPSTRRRRPKRKRSVAALLKSFASLVRVPPRYKVIRVIYVAVVRSSASVGSSRNDSVVGSNAESLPRPYPPSIRQQVESTGARSPAERSDASLKNREGSMATIRRRAHTMDFDVMASTTESYVATLDRFQLTQVTKYFVALYFSPNATEAVGLSSTMGSARKRPLNAALQRRLQDALGRARILNGLLSAECAPSIGTINGAGTAAFPRPSTAMLADVKPSALSKETQGAFHAYFGNTLTLLFYLRQQWTFHPYITPSSTTKCLPDSLRSVSVLVQPQGLVEMGEDDNVTKALMARRPPLSHPPMVGKFKTGGAVEAGGRVVALYAAYLLQGARLSVYMTASGCATVLPLLAPGNRIERFPQPNPCPADLLNTLDSVWRGETSRTTEKGMDVYFNADAVLQIITVYKDYWDGAVTVSGARPAKRFEAAGASENAAGNVPLRNSLRSAFATVSPLSRYRAATWNSPLNFTRSPKAAHLAESGSGATSGGTSGPLRVDKGSAHPGLVREGSATYAPLSVSPTVGSEPPPTILVSDTSVSSPIIMDDRPSSTASEMPLLTETNYGNTRGNPSNQHEKRITSPDPRLNGTKVPALPLDRSKSSLPPKK